MRFAAFIFSAFLAASAGGGTYYFSPSGNDANDGLTAGSPKRDLQSFVQTQTVANTIYLSAGEWQMTNSYFAIPKNQALIGNNRNSVLRGTGTNPVIWITGKTNVWLEGLTITGGNNSDSGLATPQSGGGVAGGTLAGGIDVTQVITNCLVVSNQASQYGGGIMRIAAFNTEISYNSAKDGGGGFNVVGNDLYIHHNVASNRYGGGAYGTRGTNWIVYSNQCTGTSGQGGGIYGCILVNSVIVSNYSRWSGGGCAILYGNSNYVAYNYSDIRSGTAAGTVSNTVFAYNRATNGNGGAGYFNGWNCSVISNSATTSGGGVDSGTYYDCLFKGNQAGSSGGGASAGTFYSCVFDSNTAVSLASALTLPSATYGAYNCTVVGHTNALPAVRIDNGGSLANSIVFGNASNFVALAGTPPTVNTNNIFADPSFVAGSYRLAVGSPCIDAGNNTYAGGTLDFYGRSRTLNGIVDIGAAEFDPEIDSPPSARRRFFWSLLF